MDEHWTRSKFKGKDGNLSLGDVQLGISRIKLRDESQSKTQAGVSIWLSDKCENVNWENSQDCSRKCVNSEKDVGDWTSEEQ